MFSHQPFFAALFLKRFFFLPQNVSSFLRPPSAPTQNFPPNFLGGFSPREFFPPPQTPWENSLKNSPPPQILFSHRFFPFPTGSPPLKKSSPLIWGLGPLPPPFFRRGWKGGLPLTPIFFKWVGPKVFSNLGLSTYKWDGVPVIYMAITRIFKVV